MCGCLPHTNEYCQPPKENSVLGFSQSNTLLNDRYCILKPLGQGGFGKTFLAFDQKFPDKTQESRLCVIKQFWPQSYTFQNHQKAAELFQQESVRLSELGKHPQIPQLLNTFDQDGQQYLVQEWIDGQTLEQELGEAGSFNESEIRQLLQQLLPVLQFVHDHQVIHRDIKPANIIRRDGGQLVLVDFGAAKYSPSGILENTGTLIGSAEYAAPEQMRGKPVFASDLYSLGVTCLHLLTQMSPFDLHDCSEDVWIWRSSLPEPISLSLEQILYKLVQPATKRRYQSAKEVLLDLNALPKKVFFPPAPISSHIAEDDDFETPYFGFTPDENLEYAAKISIAASLDIHSVAAVTIFDPQTQTWYHLPPKTEGAEKAQKIAAFLSPRLAAAVVTPAVPDQVSPITPQINIIPRIFFTAIALTIACLGFGIQPHQNSSTLKVENLKIVQELLNIGSK
jgi:serine/threonine protein kinase